MKHTDKIKIRIIGLLILFIGSSVSFAQVSGVITSTTNQPIENALVCLANNPNIWTKTGADGSFSLASGNRVSALRVGALRYETVKSGRLDGAGKLVLREDKLLSLENDVYHISFDHLRPGNSYSKDELKEDFYTASGIGFAEGSRASDRVSVDYGESVDADGVSLKVRFPKGKLKTASSGCDTRIPLSNTFKNNTFEADDLYISYWIKFSDNFDFNLCGGKLPSLGGSVPGTRDRSGRWKGRIMWRKGGSVQFYMELPDNKFTATDEERFWGNKVKEGSGVCNFEYQPYLAEKGWHNIELHYKFESNGNDGIFEGWVDGTNYDFQNAEVFNNYRPKGTSREKVTINYLLLSAFLGGSDLEDYAPREDVYAWFDEFRVSRTRINEYSKYANPRIPDNKAPSVSISTSFDGSQLVEGSTLTIAASATDSDGSVAKVEFFNGNVKIGEDQVAPYSMELTNISLGRYELKARATDNKGASATSGVTVINVTGDSTTNPKPNPSNCNFNTPLSEALPAFKRGSFRNAYVLGTGGPDLSQLRKFTIYWNPTLNRLFQFAINTKNGQPSYFIPLKNKIIHDFGSARPSVSIQDSGINGLDGAYWVAKEGENFVMVSQDKGYSIYFSNDPVAPGCDNKSDTGTNEILPLTVYPNPVAQYLWIDGSVEPDSIFAIIDISGKVIIKSKLKNNSLNVDRLVPGIYFLKDIANADTIKFIKK